MTTRERIRAEYAADPTLTLQAVGDRVGVTRERVRQIVKDERIAIDRTTRLAKCYRCHNDFLAGDLDELHRCPDCRWRAFSHQRRSRHCTWCGAIFWMQPSQIRKSTGVDNVNRNRRAKGLPTYKGQFFCGYSCTAKWRAAFFGYGSGHGKHNPPKTATN